MKILLNKYNYKRIAAISSIHNDAMCQKESTAFFGSLIRVYMVCSRFRVIIGFYFMSDLEFSGRAR